MLHYLKGNLLKSEAQAFVNTVNTVGIMGKGIALQFKNNFPYNFKAYAKACKEGNLDIGKLLVVQDSSLLYGEKTIINFPTKTDWRKPSEYEYIEQGLQSLVKIIKEQKITSVALPPLGAGNGGLDWAKVKNLIQQYLSDIECTVFVYEPSSEIQEITKKERVKLTPARAMLLAVCYDLVRNGEFVSEFACEKICYFLQKFGAKDIFKLDFKPNFYGPYSAKVKHVLYHLNGSYLSGYSDKNKKPFEELGLIMDAEKEVLAYLSSEGNEQFHKIVETTKQFLTGFYSSFGLELLSTIDYISETEKSYDLGIIKKKLADWSSRKTKLFSEEHFLQVALKHLSQNNLNTF